MSRIGKKPVAIPSGVTAEIANGILSERTIAALGKPATAQGEEDIVAQMERWRWLPHSVPPLRLLRKQAMCR